eukprot:Pgem_evm1s8170
MSNQQQIYPPSAPRAQQLSSNTNHSTCIIIGAGFAGLQCAEILKNELNSKYSKKSSITILEGRHRVGGRCFTQTPNEMGLKATAKNGIFQNEYDDDSTPLDLGAEWFDVERHKNVLKLAKKLNVNFIEPNDTGFKWTLNNDEKMKADSCPVPESERAHYQQVCAKLDAHAAKINFNSGYSEENAAFSQINHYLDLPFLAYIDTILQAKSSTRNLLLAVGFQLMGACAADVSTFAILHEIAGFGSAELALECRLLRLECGAGGLAERFAEKIIITSGENETNSADDLDTVFTKVDLKLNAPVVSVSFRDNINAVINAGGGNGIGKSTTQDMGGESTKCMNAGGNGGGKSTAQDMGGGSTKCINASGNGGRQCTTQDMSSESNKCIAVKTEAGEVLTCDFLVLALPVNVVDDIKFDPPLFEEDVPPLQLPINAGTCAKKWMLVDKRTVKPGAWAVGGCPIVESYCVEPVAKIIENNNNNNSNCNLLLCAFGLEGELPNDPKDFEKLLAHTATNSNIPPHHPSIKITSEKILSHNWLIDRFSKGSWLGLRAGKCYREALIKRVDQVEKFGKHGGNHFDLEKKSRVFLCGADFADGWSGWVEGALESGKEVAEKILEQM